MKATPALAAALIALALAPAALAAEGAPKREGLQKFDLPAAVVVDYDSVEYFQKYLAPGRQCEYLIFVTSQAGPQKVSVYGFLKQKP